jgi:hypothetical protein
MTETTKKFRLGAFIKDPYLSSVIQARLEPLTGAALERAREAVEDLAASALVGDFSRLVRVYTVAIAEATDLTRKRMPNPRIDRKIIKNPQLAALLDRELEGATAEEVARANGACQRIKESVKGVEVVKPKDDAERLAFHEPSAICKVPEEHATSTCSYFKPPAAWVEFYVEAVRQAVQV